MWKLFAATSFIILVIGSFLGHKSISKVKLDKPEELEQKIKSESLSVESKSKEINDLKAELESVKKDYEVEKNSLDQVKRDIENAQISRDETRDKLQEKEKILTDLKGEAEDFDGDPAQLLDEVAKLNADLDALSLTVVKKKVESESLNKGLKSIELNLEKLKADIAKREKGNLPMDFRAVVKSVYPEWGIIVINKGSSSGVIPGGKLTVVKGGEKIADLKIRTVELNYSVADLVSGSMKENSGIRRGDAVTASFEEIAKQVISSDSNTDLSIDKNNLETSTNEDITSNLENDLPTNDDTETEITTEESFDIPVNNEEDDSEVVTGTEDSDVF